jgi:hypothetical protein
MINRLSPALAATVLTAAALSLAACSSSSLAPAHATALAQHASPHQSAAQDTSGAGSGASASSINGCTLVTRRDASTAIGGDAGAGSGGTSVCSYLSQTGSVTIFVTPLSGPGDFDYSRSVGQGSPGYQDVPGVGDAGFLNVQAGSIKLNFRKGLVMVAIVCTAKTTSSVITMARTAASRF